MTNGRIVYLLKGRTSPPQRIKQMTNSISFIYQDVKDLTANNEHNEARIFIASMIGATTFAAVFEDIKANHTKLGYITDTMLSYRTVATKGLLDLVAEKFGSKAKADLRKCL